MTFEEYQQACLRTWNTKPPREMQIANAALGIVGETTEWLDLDGPPRGEELGDVWYYAAVLAHLVGMGEPKPSRFAPWGVIAARYVVIQTRAGHVAEAAKKAAFHGKSLDTVHAPLAGFLGVLYQHTANPPATWDQNVAKLRARHPSGWSANYADGADLTNLAERGQQ